MYPEPKKSKKRVLILVVAAVVVGVVIASLLIGGGSDPARQASDTFVKEVANGQADESYNLFSSNNKAFTSLNAWKVTVSKLHANYKEKPSYSTSVLEKNPGKIEVRQYKYGVSGNDGNYVLTVFMTNSDGPWQVLQFNSTKEAATK